MADPLTRLRQRITQEKRLITAYSGGVDSALLAAVAAEVLGERALAVTAVSPSLPERERREAAALARDRGMRHVEVCTDEMSRPEYVRNDSRRCAHCKSALMDALEPLAALSGARIALATNLDDLGDYRPGQQVAGERGVVFPLVDAGLTKDDVRAASRALGLATAEKPAAACLSSRIAYGDPVTPELLRRIELAEDALHREGFPRVRVRAHAGGTVARVEVDAADWEALAAHRGAAAAVLREVGFDFVTLDLNGLRSGSMNVLLRLGPTRQA